MNKKYLSLLLVAFFMLGTVASSYVYAEGDSTEMTSKRKKKRKHRKKRSRDEMSSSSSANGNYERKYGVAGCGLGSQLIGKRGSQTSAATTNGTSANQMFGITSGTSNCVDGPKDEVAQQMDRFIYANKVALADDIARGQGDALSGLAQILNCKEGSQLGVKMKENFQQIYNDERVQVMDVTDSIINLILKDEDLSKSCSSLQVG